MIVWVFKRWGVDLGTSGIFYKVVVKYMFLYFSETWVVMVRILVSLDQICRGVEYIIEGITEIFYSSTGPPIE